MSNIFWENIIDIGHNFDIVFKKQLNKSLSNR